MKVYNFAVIGGYKELKAMCSGEGGSVEEEEGERVGRRLKRLERELKLLENVS